MYAGTTRKPPDPTAMSFLADTETLRRTSLSLQALGAIDESSSSQDEGDKDNITAQGQSTKGFGVSVAVVWVVWSNTQQKPVSDFSLLLFSGKLS